MSEAIVTTTTSKDAASIIGASDDRELMSQGLDDFLPYDLPFDAVVEINEVKAKKNYDNRGIFVQLKVLESSAPNDVKVGKTYALAFFDTHKTLSPFIIAKMILSRRAFAAAIANQPDSDDFKAAPVLLQLHQEVEPLGIKMQFRNVFERRTRTGKDIHRMEYALA